MPRLILLGLLSLTLTGCSSKPKTYTVTGTVRWNNEPLKEGHILFQSSDGAGFAGDIREGNYNVRVGAGKMRVEIRASREEGNTDPVMGAKRRVQFIPARYNDQSGLEAEVTPEGENRFDFPLKETP